MGREIPGWPFRTNDIFEEHPVTELLWRGSRVGSDSQADIAGAVWLH